MIQFAYYEEAYFDQIEALILKSYTYDKPLWGLSRHEFVKAIHPDFKASYQAWTESMGLYLEEGQLVAAVLSEGVYDGDAFFIFDGKKRTQDHELLKRMVRFAVTHLSSLDETRTVRSLYLNVPKWHHELKHVVTEFGFIDQNNPERIRILPFPTTLFEVKLPKGYRFSKTPVPPFYLSNIHRLSFNYGLPYADQGSRAFEKLRTMRHYDPDLEVVILDEENRPVAFAIGWMSPSMPYAELEPMAVTWWNRRKGLGTALVHELSNRIKTKYPHAYGMTGGDQPFYHDLGFAIAEEVPVYLYKKVIHASWDPLSKDEDLELTK